MESEFAGRCGSEICFVKLVASDLADLETNVVSDDRSFEPCSGILQTILDAILPHYLEKVKAETVRKDTPAAAREEIGALGTVAASVRALVSSCEPLARWVLGWSDRGQWKGGAHHRQEQIACLK